ncbi:zinc-finger MIZ type domain containing protein [Nitzschia inconspicua]|uniref:Zinc-finger MIZ type domain containing protein n=1 Tax=Nitzschia inconspicua TaxID=303405 RepID=A0A9K3LFR9_9STRA|nr:zinc-finger MIZ type domain containing protein [Nitzschia inconspicua]
MSINTPLLNGMLRKEKAFRDEIEWNQVNVMSFASRLARGGTLEQLLGDEHMQKYRQSLKEITHENVVNGRQVTAYMRALQHLAHDHDGRPNDGHHNNNNNNNNNVMDEDEVQAKLETAVKNERQKIDTNSIEITQETPYLELCKELGERQGNEDDEIAVVNNNMDEVALKCPLTAVLMEDPVKNKFCGHSYSREAIMNHIRFSGGRKKCVCPVAGCTNRTVDESQLEEDKLTETLVRRYKKRQQLSQKSQHSALDLDEEEDDDDE